MAYTFKGGMHIPDYKELTNNKPIRSLDGDKVHIYPLQQHIGAPLNPVVEKGDVVKVGQIIADSDQYVSTPVHSSVSGVVKDIAPYIHPSGAKVTSIFVENDFEYTVHESVKPYDVDNMSKEEILSAIRNSGIVGMGGAGFPTHVKLSPPPDKKIEYLIVNGAECEPYITSDHRKMLEDPDSIIDGIGIVLKVLGLTQGYVGIETNKPDAIEIMSQKASECGFVKIFPLKPKYPQGAEKQLIYAITKKMVPSGGLPADAGAIVMNIDTVSQISKLFRTGMPLTKRVVTVSGDVINEPCNLEVYTGVTFKYLIEAAGGFSGTAKKLIMGGPMMGISQFSFDAPVIKTTSSILALSHDESQFKDYQVCIKCGKCVQNCPMRLMPLNLCKAAEKGDLETCEEYNILDCLECGLCSYNCPGNKSLLHNIRIAKQKILENRRKNK